MIDPIIFVGNLDANVTEELLYRFFSIISKNFYCQIQRDSLGKSRGFAFVKYLKREDAEKALKKLNYSKLLGKTICLMWKVKDTSKIMNEKANVFVKYLPKYLSELDLFKMAEKFGETISVKISRRSDGVSNGYGYVQFDKTESAGKFIKCLNGQEAEGLFLFAEPFRPKETKGNRTYSPLQNLNFVSVDESCLYVDQHLPKEGKQYTLGLLNPPVFPARIIVRNLDHTITSTKLASVFSNCGTVKHVEILESLGLAKVEFSSIAEAHRALRLNGTSLGGRKLVITSESCETVDFASSYSISHYLSEVFNQNRISKTSPRVKRFTFLNIPSFKLNNTSHEDASSMKNEAATSQEARDLKGAPPKKFPDEFPT